jgi:hydrophobic/amphiphilic exporter-1 (mainly G- bacteria), HAE1 family
VPNLKRLASSSIDNTSVITMEFDWSTNMDEATSDVRDALGRASRLLPDGADDPLVQKFDTSAIPVIIYSATADESFFELEQIIEDLLAGPLNRIAGVGNVSITGAPRLQVDVVLDAQRFDAYGLDLQQVAQALQLENVTQPAGRLDLGRDSYNLRVNTQFGSIEDIGNVIVANHNGRIVRLRDVARISDGVEDETAISRVNGRQGITFSVQKQSGANTVQVASAVRERMPSLLTALPPDVKVELVIDTSDFIKGSVANLSSVLFFALAFVVLVVLVFLHQWRATVIIAATIPVSLVVAFIYLALTGSTLNIISLSSLSIALGMVVDDAIVVLENIMRKVEKGGRPKDAAIYGTGEVGTAVIATTLTVVAVFLPLTFITGMMGMWFQQLGFIVIVTIVTSTLAALSLTPMMASLLLRRIDEGKPPPRWLHAMTRRVDGGMSGVERGYGAALTWALAHRRWVIGGAATMFIGSFFLLPYIGTEFMPVSDNGQVQISGELETSRSLQHTAEVVERVEAAIAASVPELVMINSTVGRRGGMGGGPGGGGGAGSSNEFALRLVLTDRDARERSAFAVADQVRAMFDEMPEIVRYSVTSGSSGMGASRPVQIHVLGHDVDVTTEIADSLAAFMQRTDGVRDVTSSRGASRPEFEFVFDRERLSNFGLTSTAVANTVRGNIAGLTATRYRHAGHEYDVVLRYDEADRSSLENVANMTLRTPTGQRVRVRDVGEVREFWTPPNIDRRDRERVVTVSAGLQGRPLNMVMADLRAWVAQQPLPAQVEIVFAGDYEEQQQTFSDLFLILALSIVLVYLVMAAQFESLREPFVIMFSIPFAFTGVLLALLVTDTPLSVIGLVGAIILVGIVVKNAIVLIDYIKLLRGRGVPVVDAIVQGGIARLRPVLMTTLTTVLAMFPLAINLGEGAEMWQPMAISVIGGLLFSTLVTLVLVPVVYATFERRALTGSASPSPRGLAAGTPRRAAQDAASSAAASAPA